MKSISELLDQLNRQNMAASEEMDRCDDQLSRGDKIGALKSMLNATGISLQAQDTKKSINDLLRSQLNEN